VKRKKKSEYGYALAIPLVAAVGVSCLACGTRPREMRPQQTYFVATTPVSENTKLLTYYPCSDKDCKNVDILAWKQAVVINGSEYNVSRGNREITRVFEAGSEVYLILRNNHSTYICELCSGGGIDYLTEAKELDSATVDGFSRKRGPTNLQLTVTYTDKDSDERGVFKSDVLLGGGYHVCRPIGSGTDG